MQIILTGKIRNDLKKQYSVFGELLPAFCALST